MRFTEHKETPVSRATSVFRWPALSKISTSCRLSMPNILLPPPSPGSQTRGRYRESSTSYAFCWMAQNFRNAESQNFRNLQPGCWLSNKTRSREGYLPRRTQKPAHKYESDSAFLTIGVCT